MGIQMQARLQYIIYDIYIYILIIIYVFNRLRRVPPATMEKGYPANQQPLHWPSKNMAFVKTLALAFNTLFVSKVFLWKRGS